MSDTSDAVGGLIGIILFLIGEVIALIGLISNNDHLLLMGLGTAVPGLYLAKAPR